MTSSPVYFDHAATTPVRPEVLDAMQPFFGPRFGNPSSIHRWGREARTALDEARERVAGCLGAHADEICFTSGGTEGDNLAVLGTFRALRGSGRNTIMTTPFEHKAVLEAVHAATREGAVERMVAVPGGALDRASFDAGLNDATALVSIMWVNNEIGTVQDIPALAGAARDAGALFHSDAVQAFGKVQIDAAAMPFHLLTISGHKIGAPKGIGAIFIRRRTPLERLLHGGSQERGRRPGTENVAFAVALATAAELALAERDAECARLASLREDLEARILAAVPDAVIHGRGSVRAPHITNVSIPGAEGEDLLIGLDLQGIAASAGSACHAGSAEASHVLTAIGVSEELAGSALRLSLGSLSTPDGVARVCEVLPRLAARLRSASTVRT
jgi:cysteine desulfurase